MKTTEKTVVCVTYLRVSTEEQADSGLGLEAQQRACADAIDRNGWETGPIFRDEGRSATLDLSKRPILRDAIAALARGGVLLVAKLDRLSRADPFATAMIEHEVRKRGARIASAAGEGTIDDSPDSILIRRLMAMLAEREALVIKDRTRNALESKRLRGERCGQLPYGFRLGEPIEIFDRKRRTFRTSYKIEPDPRERFVLERIEELATIGYSLRRIAAVLESAGLPTKSGRPWRHTTIAKILKRRRSVL